MRQQAQINSSFINLQPYCVEGIFKLTLNRYNMKRAYVYLLAGTLLAAPALTSCGTENTTGVDTETTTNEVDGRMNDEDEGNMTNENISPLDTAENNAAGGDTTNTIGTTTGGSTTGN